MKIRQLIDLLTAAQAKGLTEVAVEEVDRDPRGWGFNEVPNFAVMVSIDEGRIRVVINTSDWKCKRSGYCSIDKYHPKS